MPATLAKFSPNVSEFPPAAFQIPITLSQGRLDAGTKSLYKNHSTLSTSCVFLVAFGALEAVFSSVIPVPTFF